MLCDLFDEDCTYIYDNSEYMKEQIITYLGNKRALLPFIAQDSVK